MLPVLRVAAFLALAASLPAVTPLSPEAHLANYFRTETARLAARTATVPSSLAEWQAKRPAYRAQLQEMLGLSPWPERTDLKATITGTLEQPDLIVEKLHFQSQPGLYVTANLYRPRTQSGPLPAILYVCGHAQVITNGVRCGNKAFYQHHGIWFARHGYVCLLIDTLQLGEIEGFHHGTSRLNQWWWNSRGYSPAGVEAWNSIRAIDYLCSRPEVDPQRIGMTGRSGGGSYSWTTAALDDRIRVAAPVAGITDLQNHIVDGAIEGHCDCMFFVNTHRWDFGRNAQLIAPRPLLLVNTDTDDIFPLSGVQRVHAQTRDIYRLYQATTNLGLVIGPGVHKDTQDIQVPVFRWFNQHLKGEDPLITDAAVRLFSPLDLRVFADLPADQRNATTAEWFGPRTPPATPPPANPDAFIARLRERSFAGWPETSLEPVRLVQQDTRDGKLRHLTWIVESQPHVPLELHILLRGHSAPKKIIVHVLDDTTWIARQAQIRDHGLGGLVQGLPSDTAVAWFTPRGIGPSAWTGDARKQLQIRRRFMLLGQTLDGMRVWDIASVLRALDKLTAKDAGVTLQATGPMAVNALLATLFVPTPPNLVARELPASLRDGPDYLNILQVADLPEILQAANRRGTIVSSE